MPSRPSAALSGVIATGAAAVAVAGSALVRQRRRATGSHLSTGVPTVDGLRLNTTVRGPDDAVAAIVFAHGWTMSQEFWTTHAEAFARRGFRTVTYDQRGHGASGLPKAGGFALSHLGDDLACVMDSTVPRDMPVILVGHSMGAMSVLSWAGRRQPRTRDVRGAVLANTSMHNVFTDALTAITRIDNGAAHALIRQAVRVPTPIPPSPLTRPIVRRIALGQDAPAHAIDLTKRLFLACSPAVRVAFAREIDALDLRHGASRLDVPTLVLTGTADLLTPPSHAAALANALADGELQSVNDAGHQLPLERVPVVVDHIHRHVRRSLLARPEPAPMARPA